ncbi:sulfurtransferase [Candidatus Parcubacteria bacterium]|nr:MAG: sulfurtransferase [Candidatus Parcubacteria bacterium]
MSTDGNGYAFASALVSTDWVDAHRNDPQVCLVEVSVDTAAYDSGHIPGAVGWSWQDDTQDLVRRDIPDKAAFEALMSRSGIANDSTVILYGDMNNWFAAYAFWLLKMYGHRDMRILNGGRKKWIDEGREITTDVPHYAPTRYRAGDLNSNLRAKRDAVLAHLENPVGALVDVRSPDEYVGKLIAPPNLPQEGSQRAGHIPGAANIPWSTAVHEDGTFKSFDELRAIYEGAGITPDKDVIAYCRIGERSSHTWFVLKYLLGYPKVRNYDGSWTEWGSLIGVPIER